VVDKGYRDQSTETWLGERGATENTGCVCHRLFDGLRPHADFCR